MSDLILKEIYCIYETKNLPKEQIKNYKMTEIEIFEKYDNLSEDELNTKSNVNVYAKNDVILLLNVTEVKKKRRKENRWIQKKVDNSRI